MSYHNAGASASVLGRGNYLTDTRRVSPRLAGPPQLIAPVLGRGVADYGYLEVRPEDQALAGPSLVPPRLIAPVLGSRFGDYGYLEVRPEDQMLGVGGLDGARSRGNRWGMKYPSRVDGLGGDVVAAFPASFWSTLNASFSIVLRPAYGVIDAIPIMSAADRTKLKTRPIDFFIDLFDPIEDLVAAAIARVNSRTGKNTRMFFGTKVDMRYNRPGDERYDVQTLNLVRRLRVIQQFMTLMVQDPVNLGIEITAGALAASPLGRSMQSRVLAAKGLSSEPLEVSASQVPTNASEAFDVEKLYPGYKVYRRVKANGSCYDYWKVKTQAAATIAHPWDGHSEGQVAFPPAGSEFLGTDANGWKHYRKNGAYFVVRTNVSGLGRVRGGPRGLGGLGGVAVDDAVEATVPPAAEAASFTGVPWIDAVLSSIADAALTAVTSAGTAAVTTVVTNTVNSTFKPGTPSTVPVKVPPPSAPPPTPVTIQPSSAPSQGGGFPFAPVAIGAAVLGFLFLSGRDMQRARRMRGET